MDEETKIRFEAIEKRLTKIESLLNTPSSEPKPSIVCQELWDVENDNLNLLKTTGETVKDKTKNTALLVLLGYKLKLSKDKVLASDLRRSVAMHKIPLENFGTYLNELIPQSIIRSGKVGSVKAEYKLTHYGIALAQDLLKQISSNGQTN